MIVVLGMIIYIDLLILSTILVNLVFIQTIAFIFKEKLSILRLIFSLLLSVLMLLLYLLPYQFYFSIRYFMGIIIGWVAFKKTDFRQKVIKIVLFYLLNMTFIGFLVTFHIQSFLPLGLTVLFVVVLYLIENYKGKLYKQKLYSVQIGLKKYHAYFDTGNEASFKGTPIIFIKSVFFTDEFKQYQKATIQSIFEEKEIVIYQGPPLLLNKKLYEVYYAFVDEINYDIILNNLLGE